MSFALILLAAAGFSAGDPYDYKELVTTEQRPIAEIGDGLFDFGKDAIGWLVLRGLPRGEYEVVIGEMTNSTGHVDNPWGESTIRVQTLKGMIDSCDFRVPMPPDPVNVVGYKPETAPAIRLPEKFGVVFPFRYVEIVKSPGHVDSGNLVRMMVHYPIDMSQSFFESDNAILNEVYELCKYSILATSFCGMYVDGDRERTPYEGDAYINQLSQYAVDADYSLARKSHEWLMDHETWPTEWKQHSILIAWADWMWTGDVRSIRKFYPKLKKKLLGNYERHDIVDYPSKFRDGYRMHSVSNCVIDAFNCRNLEQMSEMAVAIGELEDAKEYRRRFEAAKREFNDRYFSEERQLYVDYKAGEDRWGRYSSLHSNAAALAFDLADRQKVPHVIDFLKMSGMACSVYFSQYLLEAYCRAGHVEQAVKLMSSDGPCSWKAMIDFGATITMEAWSIAAKDNLDMNHAWGAVPANIIARYVCGVTPLTPGFGTISIRPNLGGLKWFKARVPTAKGQIVLNVVGDELSVEIPSRSIVEWGGMSYEVGAGRHTFTKGRADVMKQ